MPRNNEVYGSSYVEHHLKEDLKRYSVPLRMNSYFEFKSS